MRDRNVYFTLCATKIRCTETWKISKTMKKYRLEMHNFRRFRKVVDCKDANVFHALCMSFAKGSDLTM